VAFLTTSSSLSSLQETSVAGKKDWRPISTLWHSLPLIEQRTTSYYRGATSSAIVDGRERVSLREDAWISLALFLFLSQPTPRSGFAAPL
jgi:hypothetical protein